MLPLIILGVLGSCTLIDAAPAFMVNITAQEEVFKTSGLKIDDMIFGPGEYEALTRKGILPKLHKLWDLSQPIPYIIGEGFKDHVAEIIDKGIAQWEKKTCIRFQKYDSPPSQHHIRFIPGEKDLCQSPIGRAEAWWQNHQDITIGSGHCEQEFVVVHEVGHSIGFYHEQMRFDRDDWITINKDNIIPKFLNNFNKHAEDGSRGIEYDYYSVMQYDYLATTSNGHSTMVPKDILAYDIMGKNYKGLTTRDILMAQKMYGCAERDEEKCGKKCQNFGVLIGSTCTCECEPGVSGDLCENRDRPYIEARHDEVRDYDHMMYYQQGGMYFRTKDWSIQKVKVDAESGYCATIEYQGQSLADCNVAYLLVVIEGKSTKYCGNNLPNGKLVSTNSEIKYTFITTKPGYSPVTHGRTSCGGGGGVTEQPAGTTVCTGWLCDDWPWERK